MEQLKGCDSLNLEIQLSSEDSVKSLKFKAGS